MIIYPALETFKANYLAGKDQLVYSKISSDILTPIAILNKFKNDEYCALFESVEKAVNRSRYSFIVLKPKEFWKIDNGRAQIGKIEQNSDIVFHDDGDDIFLSFKNFSKNSNVQIPKNLPSMSFGVYGYFSYDIVKYTDNIEIKNNSTTKIPEAFFFKPKIVLVFDSLSDELHIINYVRNGILDPEKAYVKAKEEIKKIILQIKKPAKEEDYLKCEEIKKQDLDFTSDTNFGEFCNNVLTAKQYIEAGDIFQIVLSQRFSADFKHSPFNFYRYLRTVNPSPFSFYLHLKDFTLVGSSPEILVSLKDKNITIKPIAGTRPRGKDEKEDAYFAKDLLSDPKELSEHLMLLDLARNDVGRVAKINSVKVKDKMVIEYYSHVMHITSKVEGVLNDNLDAVDAFIAGFPAGTVSGAPKIRAMQIISELEKSNRTYYAGSVGCFSVNGDLDSCISLRTALIKDDKIFIQAGGGVVADSSPQGEYQESYNKAMAIMQAANMVNKFTA